MRGDWGGPRTGEKGENGQKDKNSTQYCMYGIVCTHILREYEDIYLLSTVHRVQYEVRKAGKR